jgi:hypothetical protein
MRFANRSGIRAANVCVLWCFMFLISYTANVNFPFIAKDHFEEDVEIREGQANGKRKTKREIGLKNKN